MKPLKNFDITLRISANDNVTEQMMMQRVLAGNNIGEVFPSDCCLTAIKVTEVKCLSNIASAPKNRFIILWGPSGYVSTPLRCAVCRWSEDREDWVTHTNDRFTDGGEPATHWEEIDIP